MRLLAALTFVLCLAGNAHALGKPHLVTTCIRDAALNYELINNPKYVVPMQEIIAGFGDDRPVVFIECAKVEGIFAFYTADEPAIPKHSYVVYAPSFVRIATQADKTKLTFLLAHEYAHFALGHFTDRKHVPLKQQELAADAKGACAAAEHNGDLASIIQLIASIREDANADTGGYPSFPESEQVVRLNYDRCLSGEQSDAEPAVSRSRVGLIAPEAVTAESVVRSIDWLTSISWDSNLVNIRNLEARLPDATAPVAEVSVGDISKLWQTDDTLFIVLNDRSAAVSDSAGDAVSGPTFSGLFYIGPFTAEAPDAVVQLGLAQSFTERVTDPARLNLVLTEKIAQVALSYAALKYALETGQPKAVVAVIAQVTDFALTDLRRYSDDVTDFRGWTSGISKVDALLAVARS